MTEITTGEQQSTDQANEAMTLSEAVRIVRGAIAAEEERLKQLANDEAYSFLLEGETATGFTVRVIIDNPEKVLQILLDYQYPLYTVLEEEAPQEMWDELARMVGLGNVTSVDL